MHAYERSLLQSREVLDLELQDTIERRLRLLLGRAAGLFLKRGESRASLRD
jgi:hypothetical protein